MKAIQQELGIAKDDRESDADKFRERLEGLTVPEGANEVIQDELDKLQILEPSSAEYGVTRNYLDWMTSVPWAKSQLISWTLRLLEISSMGTTTVLMM